MATEQPSQNRVLLFRLQTLIIDGGTTVVRNIIDQKSSDVPFNVFLTQEKTSVNALRASEIITLEQYDLLYPKVGNPPSISNIDLTLATCLLRSLKIFGLNKEYSWSATPQETDTSIEADLCRLRNTRDEIEHTACTTGITQETFQNKWNTIEQVLLRLNNSVPNPIQNLQQKLDRYKNNPFDRKAEEKVQDEIDKLQEMEKKLEMEVQIVKKDIDHVKEENVARLKGDEWKRCISEGNVQDAIALLEKGNIPSDGILVDIFHAFPNERKVIFEHIAKEITSSDRNIKETVSFYKFQDPMIKIVFIAELKKADERTEIEFQGYNIEQRGKYQMSAENDNVNKEEANMEQSDFKEIEKCIREHQVNLMETHTNLMMISPSSVKSAKFRQKGIQNVLESKPCIVFYVHYKGYIPIDETPFPRFLDNIPTDVREGCASLHSLMHSPLDFIEKAIIGSAISNNTGDSGTLGCFLEKDSEIFALTSLHNMMEMKLYGDLLKKDGGRKDDFKHGTHCSVTRRSSSRGCCCELSCFQPEKTELTLTSRRLGLLTSAIYRKGDTHSSGVEIAIIKLRKKRFPSSGKFPDKNVNWSDINEETKRLEYTSGSFIDIEKLQTRDKVFKVGASSDLTKGTLRNKTTPVKFEFGTLYNCMEISWGDSKFSQAGDSGALVFAYDDSTTSETLQAVGIVTGSFPELNPTATIVTPISEIMQVVGSNYTIKSFKSHKKDDTILKKKNKEVRNTGGSRGSRGPDDETSCIIL